MRHHTCVVFGVRSLEMIKIPHDFFWRSIKSFNDVFKWIHVHFSAFQKKDNKFSLFCEQIHSKKCLTADNQRNWVVRMIFTIKVLICCDNGLIYQLLITI